MKINTILPNGKWYDNGEGIDISSILTLRNINRFFNFNFTNKLNVLEHSFICAILVPKYCDYMAEKYDEFKETFNDVNYRFMLIQALLSHDLEEIVIGDIPAPVKFDGLDEIKLDIREKFRKYIGFNVNEKSNAIISGMKHIDNIAVFIELYMYNCRVKNMMDYYVKKIEKYKLDGFIQKLDGDLFGYYLKCANGDYFNEVEENKS